MIILRLAYTIYATLVGFPIFAMFNLTTIPAVLQGTVRGRAYYWPGKLWSRVLYSALGLRMDIEGAESLKLKRGYIVIANHQSLMDIPLVFNVMPRPFTFMFKKELLDAPFFGWHLRHVGHYCIDRSHGKSIQEQEAEIHKHLAHGHPVVIFAEGTRSLDGNLQPFKRGAFQLALKTGAPIIPLYINGTFRFKAKSGRTAWPTRVHVSIGTAIDVKKMASDDKGLRAASVTLTEQVQAAMQSLAQAIPKV